MSSEVAPPLIGLAAAGMVAVAIGIVLAIRRLVEDVRLSGRWRRSRECVGRATSQEWVYRPRASHEARGVGDPSADPQRSIDAVEEARRRARVMLADAERRYERLVREREAERRAPHARSTRAR